MVGALGLISKFLNLLSDKSFHEAIFHQLLWQLSHISFCGEISGFKSQVYCCYLGFWGISELKSVFVMVYK